MKYTDQNCPLCNRPAKYCLADHTDKKFFRCDYCTDFQISGDGERWLPSASSTWKSETSENAHNSPYESVVIIEMCLLSELKPGEDPYPVWHLCDQSKIRQCR